MSPFMWTDTWIVDSRKSDYGNHHCVATWGAKKEHRDVIQDKWYFRHWRNAPSPSLDPREEATCD